MEGNQNFKSPARGRIIDERPRAWTPGMEERIIARPDSGPSPGMDVGDPIPRTPGLRTPGPRTPGPRTASRNRDGCPDGLIRAGGPYRLASMDTAPAGHFHLNAPGRLPRDGHPDRQPPNAPLPSTGREIHPLHSLQSQHLTRFPSFPAWAEFRSDMNTPAARHVP